MKIDPHGAVREPGSRGYFRTGHALDKPQDQSLSIGIGKVPDRVEDYGGWDFMISWGDSAVDFFAKRVVRQLVRRRRTPVVVIGQIASDRREPWSKACGFSQRRQPAESLYENILNKVIHFADRDL